MKLAKFLKYLIETKSYRLREMSEKSGIHDSDLSKIINGKRACGSRVIGSILGAIEDEYRAAALIAWLLDQIPADYVGLVHVVRSSGPTLEEAADLDSLAGALELLRRSAEQNEPLRAVLMNMARAFAV